MLLEQIFHPLTKWCFPVFSDHKNHVEHMLNIQIHGCLIISISKGSGLRILIFSKTDRPHDQTGVGTIALKDYWWESFSATNPGVLTKVLPFSWKTHSSHYCTPAANSEFWKSGCWQFFQGFSAFTDEWIYISSLCLPEILSFTSYYSCCCCYYYKMYIT